MRKELVVIALCGVLALVGCSSAPQARDTTDDTRQQQEQSQDVETGNFEGMAYPIPEGWSENRESDSVVLSNDDGMIQINDPSSYSSSTSQQDIADVTAQALRDSGDYIVGEMEHSTVNGASRYSAEISYGGSGAAFDGKLVLVFSDDQYWMVISGVWGDSDDGFDAILNSLVVS
jgi:major membrane immunogen (membrane-anchored lipoprotein)